MALIPTRYIDTQHPTPVDSQSDWTEAMGNTVVKRGYYQSPTNPDDEILIESSKVVLNFFGTKIQETNDHWTIERPKSPPMMHNRETFATVWLPKLGGRKFTKVQTEESQYHCFTPLAGGNPQNLAKTRRISGYVVWDTPMDPTKPTDSETTDALTEQDVTPGPVRDRIFHTGKLWSEAITKGVVIPEEGHNQTTEWVKDVITEIDLVDEEWDRWIIVTVTKNALKPGDVKVSEPREVKKDNIRYSLPVPLEPPILSVFPGHLGVQCEVKEGGADLPGGWAHNDIRILPETYKIYRAITAEPERDDDTNFNEFWDTGNEPDVRNRSVIENTAVTLLDGSATTPPNNPHGVSAGHTEPHDPEPPVPDREITFELIATLENEHQTAAAGRGYATIIDPDVEDTGEYEYFATCTYGADESTDSNHESLQYSGGAGRSYRIKLRKNVPEDKANGVHADHVDLLPPREPSLESDDYGAVFEFEIPTSDDPVEVAGEVGDRQYPQRVKPDLVTFNVLTPIPGLDFGMGLTLPETSWEAYGNGLHLSTRTIAERYMLVGFVREIDRTSNGDWGRPTTTLKCQEFPR